MGFWHTGYLDMLDMGPPGVALLRMPQGPPPPPTFPCPRCGEVFDTPTGLETHQFQGHPEPRPLLLFHGRECGGALFPVLTRTDPADWVIVQAQAARLNGKRLDVSALPRELADRARGVVELVLDSGDVSADFHLKFDAAEPGDLDGVDQSLREMAQERVLDRRSIDQFISRAERYGTAAAYLDGFAHYFYGALAREEHQDSGLDREAYVERYTKAAHVLSQYQRTSAQTVSGLVAFHFNQLSDVLGRAENDSRLVVCAERLRLLLAGRDLPDTRATGTGSGLDALLTDAATERVLRWVGIALDPSSTRDLLDLESYIPSADSYDQVKLRIIAAEHHLRSGSPVRARAHVDALVHNDLTTEWVKWARTRIPGRSDDDE